MTLSRFVKRFCLTAAMAAACALSAPVSGYAADSGVRYEHSRFLPSTPTQTEISLVRKDDLAPGQFALRVAFPVATSGCAKFENPSYSSAVQAPIITVTIEVPMLINKETPKYAHYECGGGLNMPYVDIHFSREHILSKGITTIALQDSQYNIRKDFKLNMNSSFVELIPASEHDQALPVFKAQDLTYKMNSLKYWFYPDDTYILYVPMADNDARLDGAVLRLAQEHNMTPLEDSLPGFYKPITKPNHFYFVANDDMDIPENGRKLGTITATK